jgi:GT2 family glycosyltransferase
MSDVDFSICIVTYQARDYLSECLQSIAENPPSVKYEILVVDNHSTDGTVEMLKSRFPGVHIIENQENKGFTVPMNQALRQSLGNYMLQLNPDTHVHPHAFDRLIAFMEENPDAGICGPKVLNPDGTLQKPCRRGDSRPWAVFSYFLGLSRLFPKSRFFGEYLMNYMDEDVIHRVAGVSGSCMLIRRQVIDQIGYLDELFFAYQEDADYCLQARRVGWNVYYVPTAQITHYGGQGGTKVHPYRSIFAWHRSYYLYFRKNFASDYFFLLNWFYYLVMGVKLSLALLLNLLRKGRFARTNRLS